MTNGNEARRLVALGRHDLAAAIVERVGADVQVEPAGSGYDYFVAREVGGGGHFLVTDEDGRAGAFDVAVYTGLREEARRAGITGPLKVWARYELY